MGLFVKRRSAIEPVIGYTKMDGRLGRDPWKGALGDAVHAVLCGAGHNPRLLIKKLRLFCADIRWALGKLAVALLHAAAHLKYPSTGRPVSGVCSIDRLPESRG